MSRLLQTSGLILRKKILGDNDHILTIYTPDQGKIDIIAKGARKITSKFTGHLELFSLLQVEIYRSTNYNLLRNCQTKNRFAVNHDELQSLYQLSILMEIIDKSLPLNEPQEEAYAILIQCLDAINKYPQKTGLIKESFILKFLDILGMIPCFRTCTACKKKLTEKNPILRGYKILCQNCYQKRNNTFQHDSHQELIIPFNIIKLINFIILNNFEEIKKIKINENENRKLIIISSVFLKNHLPQKLNSYNCI